MSEREVFNLLLSGFAALALVIMVVLFRMTAPYGRHARPGWGPTLPSRWAWVLMEFFAPVGMAVMFAIGGRFDIVSVAFLLVWELHYCQRAFVFPFLMRAEGRRMPVLIALFGAMFNVFNVWLNGRWLFALSDPYPATWLTDPRFLCGLAVFLFGFVVNLHSDHVLRTLRQPNETGYKIPQRGMFKFVSAANYFGELMEWIGWALLTWSWPGAVFAFWTFANLGPRALATHRWYKKTFDSYPADRKALIPFVF